MIFRYLLMITIFLAALQAGTDSLGVDSLKQQVLSLGKRVDSVSGTVEEQRTEFTTAITELGESLITEQELAESFNYRKELLDFEAKFLNRYFDLILILLAVVGLLGPGAGLFMYFNFKGKVKEAVFEAKDKFQVQLEDSLESAEKTKIEIERIEEKAQRVVDRLDEYLKRAEDTVSQIDDMTKMSESEVDAVKMVAEDSSSGEVSRIMAQAMLAYNQGNFEGAEKLFAKLTETIPPGNKRDLSISWYNWGLAFHKQGKHDKAAEKYNSATDIDPNFSSAWNGWGYSLLLMDELHDAKEKLDSANSLEPADQYINGSLAEWYISAAEKGPKFKQYGSLKELIAKAEEHLEKGKDDSDYPKLIKRLDKLKKDKNKTKGK